MFAFARVSARMDSKNCKSADHASDLSASMKTVSPIMAMVNPKTIRVGDATDTPKKTHITIQSRTEIGTTAATCAQSRMCSVGYKCERRSGECRVYASYVPDADGGERSCMCRSTSCCAIYSNSGRSEQGFARMGLVGLPIKHRRITCSSRSP